MGNDTQKDAGHTSSGGKGRAIRLLAPRLWRFLHVPIPDEPDFVEALTWKKEYTPASPEKNDYEWVRQYAQWLFERSQERCDHLDAKAESMTRFFGTSAGLLLTGFALVSDRLGPIGLWLWLAAIGSAFVTLALAAATRKPRDSFFPPTISDATLYQEYYSTASNSGATRFIAQWHTASIGLKFVGERKATLVAHATNFAILTLTLFGAAASTLVVGRFVTPSDGKMPDQPAEQSVNQASGDGNTLPASDCQTDRPSPAEQIGSQVMQRMRTDPQRSVEPQVLRESTDPQASVDPQVLRGTGGDSEPLRED